AKPNPSAQTTFSPSTHAIESAGRSLSARSYSISPRRRSTAAAYFSPGAMRPESSADAHGPTTPPAAASRNAKTIDGKDRLSDGMENSSQGRMDDANASLSSPALQLNCLASQPRFKRERHALQTRAQRASIPSPFGHWYLH